MERLTHTVARIVNAFETTSDDAIYSAVLEIVLEAFDSQAGVFLHFADDGSLRGPCISPAAKRDASFPVSQWCALWNAALAQRAVVIDNRPCRLAAVLALGRSMATPILDRARPLALLHVGDRPHDYDNDDRDMLTRIAKITGSVLSARIERDREECGHRIAEEELAKHRTELAHVLRLNTMGEMAAGIAHELNQPLSAIANYARGAVRRLRNGIADASELIDVANSIADESRRAAEIIRSLKRYVKKCEPQRSLVDVNTIVQSATGMLAFEAHQRGVLVTVHCALDLPPVDGDRVQLEQVIVNLLCNGIDALDERRRDKLLVVETRPLATGGAEVLVADNGYGLSAETAKKIFDAFYTTKPHGLGMGLAISRSMIEAHGGQLWVESNTHGGATFRFTLPLLKRSHHAN